jgi:DNA-binding transcriptional ArsR family regulator
MSDHVAASKLHRVPYKDRWAWIDHVLAIKQKLTPADKVVGVALVQHVNKQEGYAWPSHDRLAEKTALSSRHVRRSLRKLEKQGLISVGQRGGGVYMKEGLGLRGIPCRYSLTIPDLASLDRKPNKIPGLSPPERPQYWDKRDK